ncbi:hypothetical protein D3C81_1882550 [compost metagenome]
MGMVQLQGIGRVSAIPARDLKVGDITVWNFGYTSEVIEVVLSKTGKTIVAKLKSKNDNISDRKLGANRLVAISQ